MAKGYWIATYFSISNPDALAEYAKLAGPAIAGAGGRFLARGIAAKAYEKGVIQRVVLIERRESGGGSRQPGLSGGAESAGQRRRARSAHCRRARLSAIFDFPPRRDHRFCEEAAGADI